MKRPYTRGLQGCGPHDGGDNGELALLAVWCAAAAAAPYDAGKLGQRRGRRHRGPGGKFETTNLKSTKAEPARQSTEAGPVHQQLCGVVEGTRHPHSQSHAAPMPRTGGGERAPLLHRAP